MQKPPKNSPENLLNIQKEIQKELLNFTQKMLSLTQQNAKEIVLLLNNVAQELEIATNALPSQSHQSPPKTYRKKKRKIIEKKAVCEKSLSYAHQIKNQNKTFYGDNHFHLFNDDRIFVSFIEKIGNKNSVFQHISENHSENAWYKDSIKAEKSHSSKTIKGLNRNYHHLYVLLIRCLKEGDLEKISCSSSPTTTNLETKETKDAPCFMIEGHTKINNKLYNIIFALALTKKQKQGKAKFLLRSFYANPVQ